MTKLFLLILAVVIVVVLFSRRRPFDFAQGKEKIMGICATALDRTARKGGNKEKVLLLLAERGPLGNAEVAENLGVSARTIVNYMDELEREGRVVQAGSTGKAVLYHLK
jgi:biotin operon repressor